MNYVGNKQYNLLITGITGFMGQTLLDSLLDPDNGHSYAYSNIIGIARRWEDTERVLAKYGHNLAIYNGDVRDTRFLESIPELRHGKLDVIHAAAYKHVSLAEMNPMEAVGVNIEGTRNILNATRGKGKFTLISTDKACNPIGVYGQTKAIAERLVFNNAGTVLRFGNVWGSTGSVILKFHELMKTTGVLTVTNPEMTRYFFKKENLADFILSGHNRGLVIPELKSTTIDDLADAFISAYGRGKKEVVGERVGEKIHESMISAQESRLAWTKIDDTFSFDTFSMPSEQNHNTERLTCLRSSQYAIRFTRDELITMIKKDITND